MKKAESARHENHFVVGFSDGMVTQYSSTGKTTWMNQEPDNEIFCLDINRDSSLMVTGGSDCKLRMYDSEKGAIG